MEPHYEFSKTLLLWDVQDFPVPQDRQLKIFYRNIARALKTKGFLGLIDIHAYSEKITDEEWFNFCDANIRYVYQAAEKSNRLQRMLVDILLFTHAKCEPPNSNILVVAKDIPGVNTELFSVMEALRRGGRKVFFVVPDDSPESDFPPRNSANFVWRWTSLFDGDSPTVEINTDEVGTSHGPQKRQKSRKGVWRELADEGSSQEATNPAWL